MKNVLASVVIVAFVGLLCTSVLAVFSGTRLGTQYAQNQTLEYPSLFMAY